MTLSEKQREFVRMIGKLIDFGTAQGYEFTFGEGFRTPEQAALNAARGIGTKNSLHTIRLACDLNLFVAGEYITDGGHPAYKVLGEYWESIGGAWGGRFRDANHFSLEHEGRK